MTNEFLQQLIEAGNTQRALRLIDRRRKEDPDDPVLEALQGICHCDMGDFRQAAEELEHVVERHPGFLDAHSRLVCSLARLGRLEDAERWAKKLLLNPIADAGNLVKAAEALTHTRTGLARLLVKAGVAKAPKDSLCWLAWSCILARTGRFGASAAALRRAVSLDPKVPQLRLAAFYLELDHGRPEEGLSYVLPVAAKDFKSGSDIAAVLDVARTHLPKDDSFIVRLERRLRTLRRSKAGQVQELIDSLELGAA